MKIFTLFALIIFISSIHLSYCLFNPGLLVTVPFPQQPPHADLQLPLSIDPILVNNLQLSQINLKSVQYTWSFTESAASIKVSDAAVLFDWKFKSDSGQGTFQQSQYDIQFQYKFIQNSKNRIQINIVSTKSKLGHSSVHLGGTTKQTVIVEVTNLILNHAAVIFRNRIQKAISGAVQSFSSIFQHDPTVICPISKDKCVYLNSTLVSPPIINNKTLLIQLNGASYISGGQSGQLNPQTALIKTRSSKIEAQVHLKMIQQIVSKVLGLIPQKFDIDIASKYDTFDLTTLLISPLFPLMAEYDKPRDFYVQFTNFNANPVFNQALQTIDSPVSFSLNVFTKNSQTQKQEKYLSNPCNVTVSTGFKIIYGWKGLSIRVNKLKLETLECEENDVYERRVNPQTLMDVKQTMFTLFRTGINGQINNKVTEFAFNGIQAVLSGKIMAQQAIFDLTLNSVSQTYQPQDNSSFNVILEV